MPVIHLKCSIQFHLSHTFVHFNVNMCVRACECVCVCENVITHIKWANAFISVVANTLAHLCQKFYYRQLQTDIEPKSFFVFCIHFNSPKFIHFARGANSCTYTYIDKPFERTYTHRHTQWYASVKISNIT